MKTIKKVEDLQFYDDFMFCNVMMDECICTGVLNRLLNIHISKIDYKHAQEQLSDSYTAKNIRFDVYLDDGKTVYDIEMQCSKNGSIEKRVRYYQSKIDIDSINKGIDYEALKDSYIIFICKHDPYGCGFPRYEVKSYLEGQKIENGKTDNLKTAYNDGTYKLFFNAKAYKKEPDARLRAFLEGER